MLSAAAVPRAHDDHLAARRLVGPASADPATSDPVTSDPVTSDPVTSDPVREAGGVLAGSDVATLAGDLVLALTAMRAGAAERGGPLPAAEPSTVRRQVSAALAGDPLPGEGVGAGPALGDLCRLAGWGAADAGDARCAGHLHTPPLSVAVAADTVAACLNQSLDSWDQAPAMTGLEDEVVRALGALVYGPAALTSGVVPTGGTESNLMGLLLARADVGRRAWGVDVMRTGLGAAHACLRIYCSEVAHFSTQRMAGLLGLGEDCVRTIPVDHRHRMRVDALHDAMQAEPDTHPLAVVATAGTTDAGAVDPLPEIAAVAREHGCWLHVDAAYGGGALFSDRLAALVEGVELADSVALDLHKLGWQPTAAGVFLARGAQALSPLARQVAYLNTVDDEEAGYTSLLGRSIRTTRRPDALKIAVTLRALGRTGLGDLVDRCHELACYAAEQVDGYGALERALPVTLTSVVFRYADTTHTDAVNARIRRDLLAQGRAVVGRCEIDGQVWLKLTLLNPEAEPTDVQALLDLVAQTGAGIAGELA
jgi:L-2,4-diaminobutyrate decarboxylase